MYKEFKTRIKIDALPEEVYDALTKPFAIELWSGAPAVMSTKPGSEFELWEGDICGQNLEFEENKMIKQEWYFGDQEEKSIVTFNIYPEGKEKSKLMITHTNIPAEDYDDIVEGWNNVYLEPLLHFLQDEE
ncbi:MAG: SRPBCC domain-containing protein [Bacteroidales bacterium]|nr:SRPBCC domain-containing protein [Bacteroidales bacterium]